MRSVLWNCACLVLIAAVLPAYSELQNVQVGGEIRIRANYYSNFTPDGDTAGALYGSQIIWPNFFLPGRPIGTGAFNGAGIGSRFSWDADDSNTLDFVEQRTRLGVKADFTNEVDAFIELDSYDTWGEDFRSSYVEGADARATTGDDVEIYQAYIQAHELWGLPVSVRIGRQEWHLGSGWWVGRNDTNSLFTGLTLDGILLNIDTDALALHIFAAKLHESGADEEDGDANVGGFYATYKGLENINLDAYWVWARIAVSENDTNFAAPIEALEDLFHLDDYDPANLHTVGIRAAGKVNAVDFESELAYQFGNADQTGLQFKPYLYGDDGAEYDAWGANLELGYTFDAAWSPRVYLGGAYLGGDDNRSINFRQWLNPFDRPQSSMCFNRLASAWEYSEFLDRNGDLSNAAVLRAGVTAHPAQSIDSTLSLSYFRTLETFSEPMNVSVGGFKIPVAPALSFLDEENDDYLGTEIELTCIYHYSEDLSVKAGWAHLFVGQGLEDGQFSSGNGKQFNGGTGGENSDYVFVETKLRF